MTLVGQRFAYREHPGKLGDPVLPVEVVREAPRRTRRYKVKVRWMGGELEGLEEWVSRARLVVPWDEVESFLADERQYRALLEATENVRGTVRFEAARQALSYAPVTIAFGFDTPGNCMFWVNQFFDEPLVGVVLDRDALLAESHAYVDRGGTYEAPFCVGERVAHLMCERCGRQIVEKAIQEENELHQAKLWSVLPSYLTRFQMYATAVETAAVLCYVLQGKTYAAAADVIGVSVSTVFRWVAEGAGAAVCTWALVARTLLDFAPEQPVSATLEAGDRLRSATWHQRRVRPAKILRLLELCVLARCLAVFARSLRHAQPTPELVPDWGLWRWPTIPSRNGARFRPQLAEIHGPPPGANLIPEVIVMIQAERNRSALRRYAMIDALVDRTFERGEKATLLADAKRRYGVSVSTLERYLKRYQTQRVTGLERQSRSDHGQPRRLPPEALELAALLRAEVPTRSTTTLIAMVEDEHPAWKGLLNRTALVSLDRKRYLVHDSLVGHKVAVRYHPRGPFRSGWLTASFRRPSSTRRRRTCRVPKRLNAKP